MVRLKASEARQDFADTLNRVAYRGERVVLQKHGKDVAAIVPIEDLKFLDELESRLDIEAARKALKQPGTVPWQKVKRDLGL
jgi:prevent-host-death family protein